MDRAKLFVKRHKIFIAIMTVLSILVLSIPLAELRIRQKYGDYEESTLSFQNYTYPMYTSYSYTVDDPFCGWKDKGKGYVLFGVFLRETYAEYTPEKSERSFCF